MQKYRVSHATLDGIGSINIVFEAPRASQAEQAADRKPAEPGSTPGRESTTVDPDEPAFTLCPCGHINETEHAPGAGCLHGCDLATCLSDPSKPPSIPAPEVKP